MSNNEIKTHRAIFLMGPTCSGKTALALRLAQYYPIEIINVDSALIYKDLNIGSAKPSAIEMSLVPHHLINILSPLESYSVASFLSDCTQAIKEINRRGKLPLLVGGTMMYYHALMHGISQLPPSDPMLRNQIEMELLELGNKTLHDRLVSLDPVAAAKIEVNDSQRLQRALEVCILSGKPMSQAQEECKEPGLTSSSYLPLAILPTNRKLLHERINERYLKIIKDGFLDEVTELRKKYPGLSKEHNSMRCVGYRQVWDYLDGVTDYVMMLEIAKAATRQLAKRQITWLRKMPVIVIDDTNLCLDNLEQQIVSKIAGFI